MNEAESTSMNYEAIEGLSLAELKELRKSKREGKADVVPALMPRPRELHAPLSFAQERLWFLEQLGLVGASYNMPFAFRLLGELNVVALEKSFRALIRRHEVLRTRFQSESGSPVQIVDEDAEFGIQRVDLADRDPEERERLAQRIISEEAERLFDLQTGPLFRIMLIVLGPREHMLVLNVHHIVCDGWSLGVLNSELVALYDAYSSDRLPELAALPIQYADYAAWQRETLRGKKLEGMLEYWRGQLTGAPDRLTLPTDRSHPDVASFKGALHTFEIPGYLRTPLEELATRHGASLFMVILGALGVLLSRYSGETDLVIGSGVAGRTHAKTEGLIGFFVNMLILRLDLSGNPSFSQLLERAKQVTLDAYAHQDLPFEALVKELRPERNLSRQPVFQVALAMQNYPYDPMQLSGVTWTPVPIEQTTALFDLTVHVYSKEEGLTVVMEYATDLFEQETISRIADQFLGLLGQIASNSGVPIERYSLSKSEEELATVQWTGPSLSIAPSDDVVCVLEQRAESLPNSAAVTGGDCSFSYAALNSCANQVASRLLQGGVHQGELIGVNMPRGVECLVSFYAILKTGAVYVPLDPSLPAERLAWICKDAGINRVLVKEGAPNEMDGTQVELIPISDVSSIRCADAPENVHVATEWNSPAYAIYTSGSTGVPKGVLLHRLGMANVLAAQRRVFGLRASDRVVQFAAHSFDASVFEFLLALGAGATLCFGSRDELRPGSDLTEFVCERAISVMTITPSALALLSPGDVRSLRVLVVAGEEFPPELARKWAKACHVFNAYGPTETTIWATTHVCSPERTGGAGRLPIGKPVDNTQIYVLNSAQRPVGVGEIGEMYIGGLGVALGYINRPELTAERFIRDSGIGAGLVYRTGDLGRWRADGSLEYLGRTDHQAKIRGYRIEPGEVEAVLQEHPAVKQAVVVAREDKAGEKRLVAYVVGNRSEAGKLGSEVAEENLREEILGEWEELYEGTYAGEDNPAGPSFAGWNSSYTGAAIPEEEMQQWLGHIVKRIRKLKPRRVLEIGCGVGLVLQHIAPECEEYLGTDISAAALEQLKQWMRGQEELHHVRLLRRAAPQVHDIPAGSYDTVVLNSVVQYFPDAAYLRAVIEESVRIVRPSGRIFIGDVRNLSLLWCFQSSVQLSKAAPTVTARELRNRLARSIAQEKELLIGPELFRQVARRIPGVSKVEVELKRGSALNELSMYRYDVVIHTDSRAAAEPELVLIDWNAMGRSLRELEEGLKQHRWDALRIRSIPNRRLVRDIETERLIRTSGDNVQAGTLRRQVAEMRLEGVEPEALWKLGSLYGYETSVTWDVDAAGDMEVRFVDPGSVALSVPEAPKSPDGSSMDIWSSNTNDPTAGRFRQRLLPALRKHVKHRLPEYMIPSAWMLLDQLPMSPNGKVARRALPAPVERPEELGEYVAPRNAAERIVADIWGEVLRIDQVGVNDNFFELGGHSLLIVQVIDQLRRGGFDAHVRDIYANARLADFARLVSAHRPAAREVPPNLIPVGCNEIRPSMLPLINLDQENINHIVDVVDGGAQNIQDVYPLVALQEGIIFHHILNAGAGDPYVLPMLLEFASYEKLTRFISSLQRVIERHDILRTAILWEELPHPVQVVCRSARVVPEYVQLDSSLDVLGQLSVLMKPEAQRLSLKNAPLMRLQVAPANDREKWYAILQLHHILGDHESFEIMFGEVAAYFENRETSLPEPVPYREHVFDALSQERSDSAERFFREKLHDIDEPTAPFGLLDVHGDGTRVGEARRKIDSSLAHRIRAHSRKLRLTPAALFHAAWAILLARTSGREDVVFGTVLMGRLQGEAGARRILGMFINTLPIRLNTRNASITELLQATQRELGDLVCHEQSSLAVAQRCSGIQGNAPLFTTIMNFRHTSWRPETEWGSLNGVRVLATQDRTNYPLVVSVDDLGQDFELEVAADNRIGPDRILRYLSACITQIVDALEGASGTSVADISILPPDERALLITGFNCTRTDYPRSTAIHELFEDQADRSPAAIAVIDEATRLTYKELNIRATRLAWYLRERGLKPGAYVPVMLRRCMQLIIAQLAVLKAGGVYVPVDPEMPALRKSFIVEECRARLILAQGRESGCYGSAEVIDLEDEAAQIMRCASQNGLPRVAGEQPAYVMYTSGSTGMPKGVVVPHRAVTRLVLNTNYINVTPQDCFVHHSNPAFDASTFEVWGALLNGARTLIVPTSVVLDSERFGGLLNAYEVTVLYLSAGLFNRVAEAIGAPLRRVRYLLVGGDILDPAIVDRVVRNNSPERLINAYGPTESTTFATTHEIGQSPDPLSSIPIGRPIANTSVYILDPDMQPSPVGVWGEMYIGGDGVASGYLNRPELTAERFIANPFGVRGALYRTGDVGRWREDGAIEYLGRNDRQVKVRGFRVELGEIEALLSLHPKIRESVAIAREDTPGEKRLVAYVVPKPATTITADEIQAYLNDRVSDYMVPSASVFLPELPLTVNGKLDRLALPAPAAASFDRTYEAPRGQVEEIIAAIWQDILKIERVGRRDNFFELGGHSLTIVQALDRMRRAGVSADARTLLEKPVLADLAGALSLGRFGKLEIPPNGIPAGCKKITPQMLPLVELNEAHIVEIEDRIPGGAENIQDIYPLTPLQEGMLFHHLLEPEGGDTYVVAQLLSVSSKERVNSLLEALSAVVDRHDALRTAVMWERLPRAVQVVQRRATVPVEEVAFESDRDIDWQLNEWLQPELQRLDLRRAPLLRVRLAADPLSSKWYMLIQLHHLVCDHNSLGLMFSELLGALGGQDRVVEAVSYRNHVAESIALGHLDNAEEFFRAKLFDVEETTAPFGLADVHGGGGRISRRVQPIGIQVSKQVRAQARRAGVSVATLFHAAWALVVAETSGREDVVFGTVLLGRMGGSAGAQHTIGLFLNTLPLRLKLESLSVRELIATTQRELIGLLTHEQASLAAVQRFSGVTASRPLFSALLNYRHGGPDLGESLEREGIGLLASYARTNYPLTLSIDESGEDFLLTAETDRCVDPERVVAYMQNALASLVASLEAESHKRALDISVIPVVEQHRILGAFNDTARSYGHDTVVHRFFEERAKESPDLVALRFHDQSVTYAELSRKADQLARYLIGQGVKPEKVVALCVRRGIELVVALLGIVRAGGAYLPIDPCYPEDRIRYMLEDARPSVILTTSDLRGGIPNEQGAVILLDERAWEVEEPSDDNAGAEILIPKAENLVYVIYTSGSTGRPKGIAMEHGSMANLIEWHRSSLGFRKDQKVLQVAALSFDVAFQEIFTTLSTGGTLIMMDENVRRDPKLLLDIINEHGVERVFLPPLMLQSLAEYCSRSGSLPTSLTEVFAAGEQLRITAEIRYLFTQLPGSRLHNHYGPTETHVVTAHTLEGDPESWPVLPPIGRPIGNTCIYVLNSRRQLSGIDVPGEMYVAGVNVARGYLNRPGLTEERFVMISAGGRTERMYKTGDVARWREDGTLEYLGRNDGQVKIRGFRVELAEIEEQLAQHENLNAVAIVVREDHVGDKRLVAYFTISGDISPSVDELRSHLRPVLPDYMVPSAFVRVDKLPVTPSGKLDRRALPLPSAASYVSRDFEAPSGEVEETIADIWKELLKVERVGRNESFFELGGHSLTAVQLVSLVSIRVEVSAPVSSVFKYPTLREFSSCVESMREGAEDRRDIEPMMFQYAPTTDVGVVKMAGAHTGTKNEC